MRNSIFLLMGCFLFLLTSLSGFAQNVSFPDPILKDYLINYNDPVIDTNGDGEIQFSEAEVIHKLILKKNGYNAPTFSDPTGLEAFVNLKYMDLYAQPITSLNLQSWAQLDTLILEYTKLEEIDITANQNLKGAWFKNNSDLTSFIANNPNLLKLEISNGELSNLDLSGVPNLTGLTIESQEPLTLIDLSQNTALTYLNVGGTSLNSLDLSNNLNLTELNISSTPLTSIDVSQLTELKRLDLVRSKLLELDVSNNPHLEFMSLYYSYDLYYVNMRNGNTAGIFVNEGFDTVSNIQLVCVDDVDELQGVFYLLT